MTEEPDGPVLYEESGPSWWGVSFGPAFAAVGLGVEAMTGGPVKWLFWMVVALVLSAFTTLWVYAGRKHLLVRLTAHSLAQGSERFPVERVAELLDGDAPVGAKVLGGGFTVPRKREELPLRLDDDTVVVAWARDGAAMRSALHEVIST